MQTCLRSVPHHASCNKMLRFQPLQHRLSLLQVPCDPKMLIAPLQPEKLAQFSLTTLERNPRRDLVLEADLGIHISLLDIKRYSVPDNPQPLAPEDAALLAVSCPAGSRSYRSVPRTWCRLQTVVTGCCL